MKTKINKQTNINAQNRRGSVTSSHFKNFFLAYFKDISEKLNVIDWDAWYYKPGLFVFF